MAKTEPSGELVLHRNGTIEMEEGLIESQEEFLSALKRSLVLEKGFNFSSLLLLIGDHWNWIKLIYPEITNNFFEYIDGLCADYVETEPTQMKRKFLINYTIVSGSVPLCYTSMKYIQEEQNYGFRLEDLKGFLGVPVETNMLWDKTTGVTVPVSFNLFDFLICIMDEFDFISRGEQECLMIS